MWKVLVACVLVLACTSPAARIPPQLTIQSSHPTPDASRYLLTPFKNIDTPVHQQDYPHATSIVEDAFSGAFLKFGAALPEPIEIVFSSFFDQSSDSTENEWFHTASENGLHAVLLGQVHSYYRGTFDGRETTVGYSVRAVDPTTGTLLWSANVSGSSTWNHDHDPAVYAYEISEHLAEALIYSIQGR